MNLKPHKVITIAGMSAGIRVNINEALHPVYANIQALALANQHWAKICVQHIESLTSGQMKKNVFVQNNGRLEEFGEYSMILPGCRASFRKTTKGEFYIYSLEADEKYAQLQSREKKPGLFNIKKGRDEWEAEFISSGCITERKINVVAITDQFEEVALALKLAPEAISNSGQAPDSKLTSNGFDLHFTPGNTKIGGLRNLHQARNAATDPSLHESAILLAETMKRARDIKNVAWVSERGGSGVLTQAMQILKNEGVNFEGSSHVAFFSNVSTNVASADRLAKDIGIQFDGKTHSKDWFNLNELLGSGLGSGFVTALRREKMSDKFCGCVAEIKSNKAIYGTVTTAAPLAITTAYNSTAVAAAALKVTTTAAALSTGSLVFAAALAAVPVIAGGNAVVKSYFPQQHKNIQAQLKKLTGKSNV